MTMACVPNVIKVSSNMPVVEMRHIPATRVCHTTCERDGHSLHCECICAGAGWCSWTSEGRGCRTASAQSRCCGGDRRRSRRSICLTSGRPAYIRLQALNLARRRDLCKTVAICTATVHAQQCTRQITRLRIKSSICAEASDRRRAGRSPLSLTPRRYGGLCFRATMGRARSGRCWARASAGSAASRTCRWRLQARGRSAMLADFAKCLPHDATVVVSTDVPACTYFRCAAGLNQVMLTGGMPPGISSKCSANDAYRRLFRRVITQVLRTLACYGTHSFALSMTFALPMSGCQLKLSFLLSNVQNEKFYRRFPGDVAVVQKLVRHLAALPDGCAQLPTGSVLTPRCD